MWLHLMRNQAGIENLRASDKGLVAYAQTNRLDMKYCFDAVIVLKDEGADHTTTAAFYVITGSRQVFLGRETARKLNCCG